MVQKQILFFFFRMKILGFTTVFLGYGMFPGNLFSQKETMSE
ncbi:hypothetical protein AB3N59_06440 [Leptospira sp. WS92.C1]